jgi:uncharacterized phiE125 gp8 family phage protein
MLNYKVITPNATQVLALADVKKHLQIDADFTADDALITAIMTAVRRHAEEYLGRFLLPTVVDQFYNSWAPGLVVFFTPVPAITSVKYFDPAGDEITLPTEVYELDNGVEPAIIRCRWQQQWPSLRGHYNDVVVRYTAGYANAAAVPEPIKQAMLLMITSYYEHRDDTVKRMPTSSEYLLRNYRVQWLW